jgi:protein-tyrosine phosphatase
MIDIHCHILPGIDDGSPSWEITAEMCRMAAEDGIRHIVATPHANERFLYDRSRYEGMLRKLTNVGCGMKFSLGCDFHFSFDNIEDAVRHPRRYTIGDSPYLLVEFSDFGSVRAMREGLFRLANSGLKPIITHPERNLILLEAPEEAIELAKDGYLIQVTASALTGYWGVRSQRMAELLLKKTAIHVLASDAHDPVKRPPLLSQAFDRVCRLANQDVAHALFVDTPGYIVTAANAAPTQTISSLPVTDQTSSRLP